MFVENRLRLFAIILSLCFTGQLAWAGKNDVLAELKFKASSRVEKSAGVWVDGQYLGYLKELKRSKKVLLLPGSHEVLVRRAGYADFKTDVVLEPGQVSRLHVKLMEDPEAVYPSDTARVQINIEPNRAAVFVDDQYVGYVDRFDRRGQGLLLAPGTHRFKVTLPGYQTFETEMNLRAGQDYEISTRLRKGSITEADELTGPEAEAEPVADTNP